MYNLMLKDSDEIVDRVQAHNLKQARLFFIDRKQMNEKTFDSLYNSDIGLITDERLDPRWVVDGNRGIEPYIVTPKPDNGDDSRIINLNAFLYFLPI